MSHAIGYMNDTDLITFLEKAASHLTSDNEKRCTRNGTGNPFAAICILDNVSQEGESYLKDGQWVRTAAALEKLYAKAGLVRAYRTQETTTHDDYVPVTVWLLEKPTDTWRVKTKKTI